MGSSWTFVHAFPHFVSDKAHPQAPAEQTNPAMQVAPQLPQLRRSLVTSTQTPPHAS
jgi:hypothetical protein